MNENILGQKNRVLGIGLTSGADLTNLPALVSVLSNKTAGLSVHFVNTYNLYIYDKSSPYREVLDQADVVFCDGFPLAKASKLLGATNISQVRGPDFFARSLESPHQEGINHYFLGGSEETKKLILDRLGNLKIRVAGFEVPPFRELSEAELDCRDQNIRKSGATVIWVGLGTPKQDFEVLRLSERHRAVVIAVGAAFDFYSGNKPQAPKAMQRIGLEWLFRLVTEPRRLWRRYFFGNSHFMAKVLVALISKKKFGSR
jgi:N-acetylglucosaminyldiphosphoundecaprenol N-acetyl-beta-D-mannosaminyltransferase